MRRSLIRTVLTIVGLALSILGFSAQLPRVQFMEQSWLSTAFMYFGGMMFMVSVEFESSRSRLISNVVFWFGLPIITGALLWSFVEYRDLQSVADPIRKGYAGVGITLIAGLALFGMRSWYRISYGATETLVGLYLAWMKWTTTTGPLGELSKDTVFMTGLLTASIYLVVRGMDNMQTGWRARAKRVSVTAKVGPKPLPS